MRARQSSLIDGDRCGEVVRVQRDGLAKLAKARTPRGRRILPGAARGDGGCSGARPLRRCQDERQLRLHHRWRRRAWACRLRPEECRQLRQLLRRQGRLKQGRAGDRGGGRRRCAQRIISATPPLLLAELGIAQELRNRSRRRLHRPAACDRQPLSLPGGTSGFIHVGFAVHEVSRDVGKLSESDDESDINS